MNFYNSNTKNRLESQNSIEAMFFGEKKEVFNFYHQKPEEFLKLFAPNKLRRLKNALNKIKFKFKGTFIVDLTMPMNTGGYFAPGHDLIALNPMLLLYGSEEEIAHVLFHEGLHAGIYTDTPVMDESVTETLTKKKMAELYGSAKFKSGYDGMVKEISQFFGDMSFEQMSDLIEGGDKQSFDNLLDVIVVQPSINDGLETLSWEEIQKKLAKSWKWLQQMFPRMMNSIAGKNVGLHSGSNVSLHNFELEGVLSKAARRLLEENQGILRQMFMNITKDGKENLDLEKIKTKMFDEGFGYICDSDPDIADRLISEFISERKSLNLQIPKIIISPITLDFKPVKFNLQVA